MEKKKNEKQIYKYFYWEFTSEQNKLDNNTTTAEAATMQQDKQKECDCIFFLLCFLQIL